MKLLYVTAAMLAFAVPATAEAAPLVFNGVCASSATLTQAACTSTNGTYGNSVTLNSTTDATLSVKISAWQMNQSGGAVTSAFLGAYGGGFGVTGVQDNNGAGNLHQIDNVNGYTDFVILQFNRMVHLDGINLNAYGINNVFDADASFSNGTAIAPGTWNAALSLSSYGGTWSTANSTDKTAQYADSLTNPTPTGFSKVWLVSASMVTTDRDDGFKLSQLTVTAAPSVPEPATWAMMILGFGAIGGVLRRKASVTAQALTA